MKLKPVVVDVEADGPCPGLYNLLEIGAVASGVEPFYARILPVTDNFLVSALSSIGMTPGDRVRADSVSPLVAMQLFESWLKQLSAPPVFYSDNNGFDWQFINYYFHRYLGRNPFGHSSRNINDLWKGIKRDIRVNFKHLRTTKHDHNPVNDAKGNLEALERMIKFNGLGLIL